MFKRLRERIAEEATKFPVGQLSNNSGKLYPDSENKSVASNSAEDLITLSDSPSVIAPCTSSQQFSIGEEEDGSLSEQSTPQKKQNDSFGEPEANYSSILSKEQHTRMLSDTSFGQEYRPSRSSYIPQSDIESEREEPPTLNLDGISKDQLLAIIQRLKAKSYKYKNKYSELVNNYKELHEEKIKIEHTLIENQDKGLRRIAELREQCQLEQKAKAHLEANLRLLLEEKDSRISVLETQINLLKEGERCMIAKTLSDEFDISQNADLSSADTRSEDSIASLTNDSSALQEKVERLQHQHSQDKKTITAQTDQILLLRKQNESLSQELEEKMKQLIHLEDEQSKLKVEHESILKNMQSRLEELEKQQEESVMSMAETKRNMHEELELKEKQLINAEEESRMHQAIAEREKEAVIELQKQCEEKIKELQRQLESTEKALEEEKQNLMQELTRGKTAAINLMQLECAKKISAVEEEWKSKFQSLQVENENLQAQVQDTSKKLRDVEDKLKKSENCGVELNSLCGQLEKENASLKNTIEKLESENLETRHEESLKCMKDKLQNAEKNYKTQMEEMKLRISQLEEGISVFEAEKKELVSIKDKFKELKNGENEVQFKLKSKEEELNILQQKYEISTKEHVEKIHTLQESMKDKENMVLKLKTNLESVTKEKVEKIDELNKKIKMLEEEREQLMLQAQERVAATEAKCREDVRALQEINNKLLMDNSEMEKLKTKIGLLNNQLDESLLVAEANQAAASQEISNLKEQLSKAEERFAEIQKSKDKSETEMSHKLNKLQQENMQLLSNSDHVDRLKAEKEELNEKLKNAELQVKEIRQLEAEKSSLKKEKEALSEELKILESTQEEKDLLESKIKSMEEDASVLKVQLRDLSTEKENLMSEISELKNTLNCEIDSLKSERDGLLKRIKILENFDMSDPQSTSVKKYIEVIKGECETAMKAKEEEMETKLKHLVRDFCAQMDIKDKDCDKMISELIEKNQDLEDSLIKEHRITVAALRQDLFEKDCALEEIRENYEEALKERDIKIKDQESVIKNLSQKSSNIALPDSPHVPVESSDWDDTWAVPDEVENSSPVCSKPCIDHLQQIESLQEELSKSNSEIKELKLLLRLSPPESVMNNNHRGSLQSVPEPTEFEYLKNIIYEYMMGKEPVTLAKVIAAVLRFSDVQTQQVIRREESKHPAR